MPVVTNFSHCDVEATILDARLVDEASEHPSVAQLKGPLPRSLRLFRRRAYKSGPAPGLCQGTRMGMFPKLLTHSGSLRRLGKGSHDHRRKYFLFAIV